MHAHDGRTRPVACRDLLQHGGVRHDAGVGTAVLLRHQHAEEAEFAHFLEFGGREGVGDVARGGPRRQPLAGELARRVAHLQLYLVEQHDVDSLRVRTDARPQWRSLRRRRCTARRYRASSHIFPAPPVA